MSAWFPTYIEEMLIEHMRGTRRNIVRWQRWYNRMRRGKEDGFRWTGLPLSEVLRRLNLECNAHLGRAT